MRWFLFPVSQTRDFQREKFAEPYTASLEPQPYLTITNLTRPLSLKINEPSESYLLPKRVCFGG